MLKPSEWTRALELLGMQGSYHPQNLTGSYQLNLARGGVENEHSTDVE